MTTGLGALLALGVGCDHPIQNTDSAVQAELPDSRFGFDHALGVDGLEAMEALHERGHRGLWHRPHLGPFVWGCIQTAPDAALDWSRVDREVRRAQTLEMHTLATIHAQADWDHEDCSTPPADLCSIAAATDAEWGTDLAATCHPRPVEPRDTAARATCQGGLVRTFESDPFPELGSYRAAPCAGGGWTDWLTDVVERYDGDGDDDMPGLEWPVRTWEVGNEPFIGAPWRWHASVDEMGQVLTFFTGTPQDYADHLVQAAAVIRATDPGADVLHAGTWDPMHPDAQDAWAEVFDQAGDVFTISGTHCIHCEAWSPDANVTAQRELLGDLDRPVWVTEIEFDSAARVTPDEAARHVQVTLIDAFAAGADKVFLAGPTYLSGPENPYALWSEDGPTPVFEALDQLMVEVDGFTEVERLGPGTVRFGHAAGSVVARTDGDDVVFSHEP